MSVGLAIAERWLGALFQSSRLYGGGLAHLRAVRRWLHDGGDFERGGLARRASQARQALLDLRFQPRVASRAIPRSPLPRTSRPAFSAMAGMCCMCATPMTRRRCWTPSISSRDETQPSDADHHREPYRLRRTAQAGYARRPMANRWARRRSETPNDSTAGPKMHSSWCRTACTSISPTASAHAVPRNMREWRDPVRPLPIGPS